VAGEWPFDLTAMFHTSGDSRLFRTAQQLLSEHCARTGVSWSKNEEVYLPFYEAKMFYQYNHRHGDYASVGEGQRPHRLPRFDDARLHDPQEECLPFYWVNEREVDRRLNSWNWTKKWLFGWRDVADARASVRSSVFSVFPTYALGDTILIMLPRCDGTHASALLGLVNSIPFDYFARQKIGGLKFKHFTMRQIVAPPPHKFDNDSLLFIRNRVLELTYTSYSIRPFALELGFDGAPFSWDEERRALLRAELDALYAKAYGLTRDELRYILDPSDVRGPDYPSETFRVLKDNEMKRFGEYRTRRMVLEAWDRQIRNRNAA
jgi:hypothetical protein